LANTNLNLLIAVFYWFTLNRGELFLFPEMAMDFHYVRLFHTPPPQLQANSLGRGKHTVPLKICKMCKKEVSTIAQTCPHCGAKNPGQVRSPCKFMHLMHGLSDHFREKYQSGKSQSGKFMLVILPWHQKINASQN
jgi:hypothetical protein